MRLRSTLAMSSHPMVAEMATDIMTIQLPARRDIPPR
jgi:hypothetical protein